VRGAAQDPPQIHRLTGTKGFTLVELIVVIVILGILLAIAAPALTGYIDKAKWADMELRIKTAKTAFQTMINETYAEEGGFTLYAQGSAPADALFLSLTHYANPDGYYFNGLTSLGVQEYESLTADKTGIAKGDLDDGRAFSAITTSSGAMVFFRFVYDEYRYNDGSYAVYGGTYVYFIENSADPDPTSDIVLWMDNMETMYPGIKSTFTSGVSVYKMHHAGRPDSSGDTWEKLY
jgi:prepilin-type N-terminal cleavage/methylation domain-containing protein